jgi:hypothetical protein
MPRKIKPKDFIEFAFKRKLLADCETEAHYRGLVTIESTQYEARAWFNIRPKPPDFFFVTLKKKVPFDGSEGEVNDTRE